MIDIQPPSANMGEKEMLQYMQRVYDALVIINKRVTILEGGA